MKLADEFKELKRCQIGKEKTLSQFENNQINIIFLGDGSNFFDETARPQSLRNPDLAVCFNSLADEIAARRKCLFLRSLCA